MFSRFVLFFNKPSFLIAILSLIDSIFTRSSITFKLVSLEKKFLIDFIEQKMKILEILRVLDWVCFWYIKLLKCMEEKLFVKITYLMVLFLNFI